MSSSRNATISPPAAASPAFLARLSPLPGDHMYVIATEVPFCTVPSAKPACASPLWSTTTSSVGSRRIPRTLSTGVEQQVGRPREQMTTVVVGFMPLWWLGS